MGENKFLEEEMDWRFFLLRFFDSIWKIVIAALAGAAICAGGHMLYRHIVPAQKQFQAEAKLYIDFAEDSTGIGYGYYNDYTWKDLIKSNEVLLYAMELLPETITKETVEEAVEADIISDVRLLTITVTATEEELADSILTAMSRSLEHFPEEIKEIEGIRIIRMDNAKEIVIDEKIANRAVFGAVFGALAAAFAVWLLFSMDAGIYLPKDVESRLDIPVLGVIYKKKASKSENDDKDNRGELEANLKTVLKGGKEAALLTVGKTDCKIEEILNNECNLTVFAMEKGFAVFPYEEIRNMPAVLLSIPYGTSGKQIERLAADIEKQQCKIAGVILCDADEKLYRRYYLLR